MIGPLEHQPVVALELAVVRGEEDVGVLEGARRLEERHDAAHRLVDELVLHVDHRVDLAHLIVGHPSGDEARRPSLGVAEAALVPRQPVRRPVAEDLLDGLAVARVTLRQWEVAPVDALLHLVVGRVEG